MSWIAAGIGLGVGGILNYEKNKVAQNNEKQALLANAAQDKYAPWTGAVSSVKGPTVGSNTLAGVSGALQGGLAGYTLGSQFSNAPSAATAASAGGANALGGTDMSNQLANNANQFNSSQANMAYMQPMAGQTAMAQSPQMGSQFGNQAQNTWALMPKSTYYGLK